MKYLMVFFICLPWFGVAHAQIYQWVDANGKTHYTNSPPPAGAKIKSESKEITETPEAKAERITRKKDIDAERKEQKRISAEQTRERRAEQRQIARDHVTVRGQVVSLFVS